MYKERKKYKECIDKREKAQESIARAWRFNRWKRLVKSIGA